MKKILKRLSLVPVFVWAQVALAGPLEDTKLLEALAHNNTDGALEALEAGANVNSVNDSGASALFIAVQKRLIPVANALLESGANPDVVQKNYMGATPLMIAVQVNDIYLAQMLLEYDASVNLVDTNGDPAINWAAYYGYTSFAKLFLTFKADTSLTGHGTAREIAMRRGHQDFVSLLARHAGTAVPSPDTAALIEAIKANELQGVAEALFFGVAANSHDFTDRPVLALAARLGATAILEQLLAAGAPVDLEDAIGFTSLMEAARDGMLDTASLLLKKGANPNHRANAKGLNLTPMHMAALSNSPEMINLLTQMGATIDPLGRDNGTPLMWALSEGKTESAMTLLKLGADPHIKSNYGHSSVDIVKSLGDEALLQLVRSLENRN